MTDDGETRAEAFRGAAARDGIALEFGFLGGAEPHPAAAIRLVDRVVMPLETAQRLIVTLGDSLQRAHAGATTSALQPVATVPTRGEIPVNAEADPAGEKASLLMRLVSGLGVPFQHERSFSMADGELSGNRFLLTVARADLGEGPLERVLGVCRQLAMPPSVEPEIARHFDASRCLHFGFEARRGTVLCKLYLEREFTEADAESARTGAQPIPLHLAFKWDTASAGHVVSRYLWHPGLAADEMERRLRGVYAGQGQGVSLDIAMALLSLGTSRVSPEQLQYLEVLEDGNDRRSFDLNVYPANLHVKDVQHLLSRMRAHYGIRPGQFQALFDQVKGRVLGHIAGGVHRDGRDFFTVYYGVEGFPRFAGAAG